MDHNPPQTGSKCIGWCCQFRFECEWHVTERDFVITRWFMPLYPGEDCEHFSPILEDD